MSTEEERVGQVVPVPTGAHVPPVSAPEIKSLLALAVAAIVIAALYVAQDVLVPITLAILLSFVLSPLVNLLRRLGVWRGPSVILSVLVALGAIGLVGTLIGTQAALLAADAPAYAATIERKVEAAQAYAIAQVPYFGEMLGGASQPAPEEVRPLPAAGAASVPNRRPEPLLVELAAPRTSFLLTVLTVLDPVLAPLETTIIVLVVAIFILVQKEDLRDRLIRLFGSSDLHRTTLALDDAADRLSRYFLSQLAVNATFGVVIGLGLWAIGIPSPALWGGVAGLLRFVPYVGPLLAAIPPLAVGAAIDSEWWTAINVALLFLVTEPLAGYVVEPLLYSHSTGLSPVAVIVAAIFWTWIWGPIGLILSTPLTLCMVVMGRHVKSLEFFDVLLGDCPPLTAVETFYQRILADNPDEALDKAESMLADGTLLDYYDTVVLQVLKLAARDQARGTITRERSIEMTRSMLEVIDDLAEHVDADAADARSSGREGLGGEAAPMARGAVACISGRGPFDDAITAMLVQLLRRRGIEARPVQHTAVARDSIAQLDLSDATVIALSYLEIAGAPARLRHLVQRLRQHAPHAAVIVGLWPEGEAVLSDPVTQKSIGADRYACSLREAIDATVTAAGAQKPHAAVLP